MGLKNENKDKSELTIRETTKEILKSAFPDNTLVKDDKRLDEKLKILLLIPVL